MPDKFHEYFDRPLADCQSGHKWKTVYNLYAGKFVNMCELCGYTDDPYDDPEAPPLKTEYAPRTHPLRKERGR